MTPDTALYQFFNGFMTSYPATAVPDDAVLPWLTYEYAESSFGGSPVSITANMWFKTDSEALPNKKARELREYIESNGMVQCDDGALWIKPGRPWSQAITDEDASVKRRYINIEIDFITR